MRLGREQRLGQGRPRPPWRVDAGPYRPVAHAPWPVRRGVQVPAGGARGRWAGVHLPRAGRVPTMPIIQAAQAAVAVPQRRGEAPVQATASKASEQTQHSQDADPYYPEHLPRYVTDPK